MDKITEKIDELLERSCFIIDYLPQKVSKTSSGQFFEVEHQLLNGDKHHGISDKFLNVILKLMCYYHVSVWQDNSIDRPKPHSGTLNVLFPEDNALLVFDWDCLNLSVYHPTENMKTLMEKVALSEGLFWREARQ